MVQPCVDNRRGPTRRAFRRGSRRLLGQQPPCERLSRRVAIAEPGCTVALTDRVGVEACTDDPPSLYCFCFVSWISVPAGRELVGRPVGPPLRHVVPRCRRATRRTRHRRRTSPRQMGQLGELCRQAALSRQHTAQSCRSASWSTSTCRPSASTRPGRAPEPTPARRPRRSRRRSQLRR